MKFKQTALALGAGLVLVLGPSAAAWACETPPEECVPSEAIAAYDDPDTLVSEAYDDEPILVTPASDTKVIDTEAVDKWYSWTGGPADDHPFPNDNWQPDNGNHNGFDQSPGLLQRDKGESGRSDFFWHEVVAEVSHVEHVDAIYAPGEHHDAVYEPGAHHDAVPAVTCETPPPTFDPTCTSVNDTDTIQGTGVIEVAGDWDEDWITVPFSGTLADIGTVLDIQATPLQYVGLHIDTTEGTIVFEEEPSYGGNLWSNSSWDGVEAGLGYPAFGSIDEYIELNGDVSVTGIRLLYTSPEASSTKVSSFTIACTTFTFVTPTEEPTDEPTETPTPTPTPTDPVTTPPATVTPTPVAAVITTTTPPTTEVATAVTPALASTGSTVAPLLITAAVLLMAGAGIMLGRRKFSTK